MPFIEKPGYKPPFLFRNAHLHTVFPSLFRRVRDIHYIRERLELPDGDFVDLDWSRVGSRKIALICHGLEGSSDSEYIKGLARAFNKREWDAVAFNFRGCSGEPNRLMKAYHSGETEDLNEVIVHLMRDDHYDEIVLAGFSLGGNVVLKYVGERSGVISPVITGAAAVSVPCDLTSAAYQLAKRSNMIYMRRFLRRLRKKVQTKSQLLPENFDVHLAKRMKTFKEFDDWFTAPVHGFKDAAEYWRLSSSRPYLPGIRIPTLLINAQDDPFLTPACFPIEEARKSEHFYLEAPRYGGHVGFISSKDDQYYFEKRLTEFLIDRKFNEQKQI